MKTEHGHTPAPWVATGYKNTVVNDANGNTLALYPAHDSTTETAQANAKLIAAAPELLAALNRALPWLGRLIADGGHLNSVAPNDAIGAMNQAQAAIDKATGNV